jgi:hypothetical protein
MTYNMADFVWYIKLNKGNEIWDFYVTYLELGRGIFLLSYYTFCEYLE